MTTTTAGGGSAPVETEVLREQLVNNSQVIGATLPRTGTGTSLLLVLAGLVLVLGGLSLRFGRPVGDR